MVDDETLSMNVLQFAGKNFDYESTVRVASLEYAIFARTETETEAKLRPQLVRLRVVVPREWVHYEEAFDTLVLVSGQGTPGPQRRRAAGTTMLEPEEFRDQGIDWHRLTLPGRHSLYLPKGEESRLLTPEGRAALGVPA
ncbi:MAG: hypothetical protein L3K14_07620 [Thermoplasmata archaeon]|nr:hypothetical protein [Thermoplasmata archaeon]